VQGHPSCYRLFRAACALSLLAASLAASAGVKAQDAGASASQQSTDDSRTTGARAHFQEGLRLADQGKWAEAAEAFRLALDLRATPGIRYNLAAALVELGRHREAAEQLDALERDISTTAELRQQSDELKARVEPQIGRVTIRVTGDTSVRVRLDNRDLDPSEIGVALPIEPGDHAVVATRDGEVVARQQATVRVREQSDVQLDVAPAAEAVARGGEGGPPAEHVEPDDDGGSGGWIFWAAAGAAAVAIAAAVLIISVSGEEDPVEGNFQPGVLVWE